MQAFWTASAIPGRAETIRTVNRHIREAAAKHLGVYVLDYDALIARFGRLNWGDESKWLTMRMPLGGRFLCSSGARVHSLSAAALRPHM